MYQTIKNEAMAEYVVEKSRFLSYVKYVETEEQAKRYISEIKAMHPDARHHVPAYVIGESSNLQRFSDDGEPSGTAGIPTLEVLKKRNLTMLCIVTVRYFGGILLGAGGLIRAYTRSASLAIEAAGIVEKRWFQRVMLRFAYSYLTPVNLMLEREPKLHQGAVEYLEDIRMEIFLEEEDMTLLTERMNDSCSGQYEIAKMGNALMDVDVESKEE